MVIEIKLIARAAEGGAPRSGFQAVFTDVTDRRRATSERATLTRERRARAEAEAANHLKDEFLGIVSHELRTPLNALLGWIEILNVRSQDPGVLERGLVVMGRNGRSLVRLVDDLLDVSRIVSGKLELDLAPLAAEDVVRNAVDQAKAAAQAKDVALTLATEPGCRVRADRLRLQQVVSNLLSNALKFTASGGHVDVVVVLDGRFVQLRVRDDGCGIDSADLPHVFERFRQGMSATTRQYGGLGLGLAITRYIVEAHDGTIEAASLGRGRGAEFTVTLPALDEDEAAGPEKTSGTHSAHPGPSIAGVKVLCVDDEPDTLELVALMLTAAGAAVRTAGSVGDALATLQSFNPDVVLSDVAMPEEDGYELVARVRKLEGPLRETPVVAFTACARLTDEIRAVQAGFDAHLSKPVDAAALVRVIARLLRRRAAAGHSRP